MRARLLTYLELVRVFLTPSAPADSIAGCAVAMSLYARTLDGARLGGAVAVSILLYWFGMASNDLFDRRVDRTRAPHRPLPSGRIGSAEVAALSLLLAALGLVVAWLAGILRPALGVLTLAVTYNAGGKRIPVAGSVLMGSSRAANFLLGAAALAGADDALTDPRLLGAAGLLCLYVAGVTAVSLLEDRRHRPAVFHALAAPLLAIPLALGALQPFSVWGWMNTIALLWILIHTQRRAASHRFPAQPAAVYVRGALGGIFLVDAGLVWTFSRPESVAYAAPVALYLLALLGWWWRRQWIQSGGPDT